jgi:AraC-like DNA-binding protein
MSASAFHRNFQAVTAMSPIQFERQLRLQEAGLLLATRHGDISGIGYDSPSQLVASTAASSVSCPARTPKTSPARHPEPRRPCRYVSSQSRLVFRRLGGPATQAVGFGIRPERSVARHGSR